MSAAYQKVSIPEVWKATGGLGVLREVLTAVLCTEEEEKEEEEGGSVSSCFVSANAVAQLKQQSTSQPC